ncbi:MAG: ferredoxin-NADP reductase [Moritella dasanensis]|jgi:ferredoxin-NADP reductase
MLRISVKRETASDHLHSDDHLFEAEVHEDKLHEGKMSCYLHDYIRVGDKLQLKGPKGTFTLDATALRPAVLLAGGVGITPMIAMTRQIMSSVIHSRHLRSLTIIAAAKDALQRAFFDEFNQLSAQSGGDVRTFWALSQPESTLKLGQDYHHSGRINKAMLQAVLPIDDYDFYLCGPSGFMQSMYDLLRSLGISNARIKAEEFGPASLQRQHDQESTTFAPMPTANAAIIEFSKTKVEQAWSASDGTLLEFAEDHGFRPEFGCRSGQCGACKTKLLAGKVSYQTDISASLKDDEVLLCCAVPAAVSGEEVVNIKLEL